MVWIYHKHIVSKVDTFEHLFERCFSLSKPIYQKNQQRFGYDNTKCNYYLSRYSQWFTYTHGKLGLETNRLSYRHKNMKNIENICYVIHPTSMLLPTHFGVSINKHCSPQLSHFSVTIVIRITMILVQSPTYIKCEYSMWEMS